MANTILGLPDGTPDPDNLMIFEAATGGVKKATARSIFGSFIQVLSEAEYAALDPKNPDTLYIIVED